LKKGNAVRKKGQLAGRRLGRGLLVAIVAVGSALLVGCASSLDSETIPGVDLAKLNSFYVRKLPADGRGVERLISERLVAMGKRSSYGPGSKPSYPVDAIVTYQDHWMWDITMYMLELSIQIRDPANDVQLASGHSMRTSLIRKSPQEMVKEVLDRIFGIAASPAGGK
jgi:hypothetical protein